MLSKKKRRVLSIIISAITLTLIWLISCVLLIYFKYVNEIKNSCETYELEIGNAIQIRIKALEELMRDKTVEDGIACHVIHLSNIERYLSGLNCKVEWHAYKETEAEWRVGDSIPGFSLDSIDGLITYADTSGYLDGSQRYVVMTNVDSFYDFSENDMGQICPIEYFQKVQEVTFDQKKNPVSHWIEYYSWEYVPLDDFEIQFLTNKGYDLYGDVKYYKGIKTNHYRDKKADGWNVQAIDYYENGSYFIPGKVRVYWKLGNKITEERIIDCTPAELPAEYVHVENAGENEILFPEDMKTWHAYGRDEPVKIMAKNNLQFNYSRYVAQSSIDRIYLPFSAQSYVGRKNLSDVKYINYLFPEYYAFNYLLRIKDGEGTGCSISFYLNMPIDTERMLQNAIESNKRKCIGTLVLLLIFVALAEFARRRRVAQSAFRKSLLDSMAHDLKSPLMVMHGFAENLQENVHSEKREYYASEILKQTEYLNGIVNKNMQVSQMESSDDLDRNAVRFAELFEEAVKRYREQLDEKKIQVVTDGQCYVWGDEKLLASVADNLVANAMKYTTENGIIDLKVLNHKIIIQNTAELVYHKPIQRLLEEMEMGDDSRSQQKGTGMGLSIVYGILNKHRFGFKIAYKKKSKLFQAIIRVPDRYWIKIMDRSQ